MQIRNAKIIVMILLLIDFVLGTSHLERYADTNLCWGRSYGSNFEFGECVHIKANDADSFSVTNFEYDGVCLNIYSGTECKGLPDGHYIAPDNTHCSTVVYDTSFRIEKYQVINGKLVCFSIN